MEEMKERIKQQDQKIKEQDRKIHQLMKTNKDFKNSVLTLYTELEKSKERERSNDRVVIEIPSTFPEKMSSTKGDSKIRLDNKDLQNLFKGMVEN